MLAALPANASLQFLASLYPERSPRCGDIETCSTSYPGALRQDPSPEELPKEVGRAHRLIWGVGGQVWAAAACQRNTHP